MLTPEKKARLVFMYGAQPALGAALQCYTTARSLVYVPPPRRQGKSHVMKVANLLLQSSAAERSMEQIAIELRAAGIEFER